MIASQSFAQSTVPDKPKFEISDDLRAKANSTLLAMAREADQFFLPENRIKARIMVAHLLWDQEPKQSMQLMQNAIGEMDTLVNGLLNSELSENDYYYEVYTVGELRKSLLLELAEHDPVAALAAFKSLSRKKAEGEDLFDGDADFELELAKNIAAKDPNKAFEVAMRKLESGLGYGAFEALENIYKKDKDLGAKMAREILRQIKAQSTMSFPASNANSNANVSNMNSDPSVPGETEITVWQMKEFVDKVRQLNNLSAKDKESPALTDAEYRELIEVLARKYTTQQYLSSYEVAGVLKDIEKYFPNLGQAIRRRLASEKDTLDKMVRESAFDSEIQGKNSKEIALLIERKPQAQRDALYHKAAETAFNNGDILTAKEFYDKAVTKPEYDYLGEQINMVLPKALAETGDLTSVRERLAEIKTPEEKIEILTTLAQSLAASGNTKTAKELTEEARSIYSGKMKNRRNLASVMQMSASYAMFEPDQSFAFIEQNTSIVNELISAAIVLDDFNEYGSVKDDELLLTVALVQSYQGMPKGVLMLRNLSKADFERTSALADKFSRREARFAARMRILQALLDPKAEEIEAENQQVYEEGC